MAHDGQDLQRRTVLRSIAVGGSLAAGVGTAAGDGGSDSLAARRLALEQRFGDVGTVRRIVAADAGPVVDELADLGYVDASHEVAVDSVLRKRDYRSSDATDVATVDDGRLDGTRGALVNVRQRVDGREVEFYFLPEHDVAGYAVVSDGADGPSVLVEPGVGSREVETESCGECPTDCDCSGEQCDCSDLCDCTVGGYKEYTRERRDCVLTTSGDCLCSWCDYACDCQGEQVSACPE